MATRVIGISDMRVSAQGADVLITHSLGTCVCLTAWDPGAGVGGMIHCLLPSAEERRGRGTYNPCVYVSTGVPALLKRMYALGAGKGGLILKAAGGASVMNAINLFDMGGRNKEALLGVLDAHGLSLAASDLGGTIPRTVALHLDSGRVVVKSLHRAWEL